MYQNEIKIMHLLFAYPFYHIQLKELGHLGVNGVHAQLHVIQDQDLEQEVIQVANLVLEAQQILQIATVSGPLLVTFL